MHIIRLSGHIRDNKIWEFKQNVRQIFGQLSPDCADYSVSVDLNDKGLYHIQLGWDDPDNRDAFLNSENYKLLLGSYNVLGILNKKYVGEFDSLQNK